MQKWHKQLKALNPSCTDALEWALTHDTPEEAWAVCERGDWMLWYAARVGLTPDRHKQIVKAICHIVERHLDKLSNETRPRIAIETAIAWATEDKATLEEINMVAAKAVGAVVKVAGGVVVKTVWAVEAAAGAAWAAARAAAAAGIAVKIAKGVAMEAVAGATRATKVNELSQQADIIRQYLSCPKEDQT
jgi:hypothetical protein